MYNSAIYELFSSVIAFTYLCQALVSGAKMGATIGDTIPTSLFCKDDSTNVGVSTTASGGSGDNNGGSSGLHFTITLFRLIRKPRRISDYPYAFAS